MRHLEAIDRGEYPESSSKRDDPEGAARPVPRGQICQMREVLRILRNLVRYENQIEVRMGSLLLEQHERRAWPAFECHSLGEYAEERLGWIGSSAGRRVDAARAQSGSSVPRGKPRSQSRNNGSGWITLSRS
jgi:hypothetical protein